MGGFARNLTIFVRVSVGLTELKMTISTVAIHGLMQTGIL
jgi:hypothetical protein